MSRLMKYLQQQEGRSMSESAQMTQIQQALYVPGAEGIYASAMEHYFQDHAFRTFSFRGDWELLQQHLKKSTPLIAALKPSGTDDSLHYVVVVGVDPEKQLILLND